MPVLLGVETLMLDRDLQPKAVETLEMIRRNVMLESQFIDELLDMTRVSRGKFDMNRQPMDLHQAARLAAEVVMPEINKKGQRLIIALDASVHELSGDLKLLQQVLWNLLKNASKFTPEGGEIAIRSRNESVASDNPDRIVIEVSDSGIGFDAEDAERIFAPFIQANQLITHRFGGLGLGLAISKATVDAHGGTIRGISLGSGKGATFTVSLPLSEPMS
jgi:two-component system CheB/CheR fusion protein